MNTEQNSNIQTDNIEFSKVVKLKYFETTVGNIYYIPQKLRAIKFE
jgi:hypothetical protein